ncbi:MAG: ion channel [Syntrophobacteraceae bacterium]
MEKTGFKLKLYFGVFLAILALGTFIFSKIENLSFLYAFYLSIVTIAAVGYGDIHPTCVLQRLFMSDIAGLANRSLSR